MKKVTKLRINRKRWLRGGGGGHSLLRDHKGHQCCLGFYGRALGNSEDKLYLEKTPGSAYRHSDALFPEWLFGRDANDLMRINDNTDILDSTRERRISQIFARHGVDVEFFG